jgi:hypothetical protein
MFPLLNYLGNKDEANGMNKTLTLHPLYSEDSAAVAPTSWVRPVQRWTHLHTQYHVLCKPDDCQ